MQRREFLATCGGALAATVLHAVPPGTPKRPMNVLFIAVDDLRPQLGCYGHTQMISPSIDALAARGMVFTRAYCQVPVCGASRASLLTGLRPTPRRFLNFSTRADKDAPGVISLPGQFKQHGYRAVSNGKVYHHADDNADHWSRPAWRPRGDWAGRGYLTDAARAIVAAQPAAKPGRGPAFEAADVDDNRYGDGMLAEKTIADLRRLAATGKPFFCAAGFFKPHLPFCAPKKYWDLYDPAKLKLADNPLAPKGAPANALHNWGELRAYHGIPAKGPAPDELARKLIHGYYACVSYTDAQIGNVLAELDKLGIRDNTIVVLWGDHGWQLGEHGMWCKHCNFNTSLNAPLILSVPGYAGGQRCSALVEFVDIYPTLCELTGLPLPEHLQGTSMVPLLKDPRRPWKTAVFSRWKSGDSVRTDRYLYTQWPARGGAQPHMLYDHSTDPGENVNIADRPENRDVVAQLQATLKAGWRKALPPKGK